MKSTAIKILSSIIQDQQKKIDWFLDLWLNEKELISEKLTLNKLWQVLKELMNDADLNINTLDINKMIKMRNDLNDRIINHLKRKSV